MPARIPPGRAGRMWLQRRLEVAERGREHLDRRLHLLVQTAERAAADVAAARTAWGEAYAAARTAELRAALVDGADALGRAARRPPAEVRIGRAAVLGVERPADPHLVIGEVGAGVLVDGAATGPAVAAAVRALEAAVRLAVAQRAEEAIEGELAATRRRLRALDERRLPWLARRLAERDLELEQAEQEEAVRLRRAVRRG